MRISSMAIYRWVQVGAAVGPKWLMPMWSKFRRARGVEFLAISHRRNGAVDSAQILVGRCGTGRVSREERHGAGAQARGGRGERG